MTSCTLLTLSIAPVVASALLWAPDMRADAPTQSVTFAFDDVDDTSQAPNEAFAYETAGAEAESPLALVVFLHAPGEPVVSRFDAGNPRGDLRALADSIVAGGEVRPFVLAAPQRPRFSNDVTASWDALDLEAFVEATEHALGHGVRIDRRAVVVVRDRGSGCGPTDGPLAMLSPSFTSTTGQAFVVSTCPASNRLPDLAGSLLAAFTLAPRSGHVIPGAAPNVAGGIADLYFVDPRPSFASRDQALERTLRFALPKLLPMQGAPSSP